MARQFEDLECWRLADRLRSEVLSICAQEQVTWRRKFCDGFTDAAGSVCRNISEGFGRYRSGSIVQYFTYALASLQEVKDYLRECHTRGFIDQARLTADLDLLEHTKATTLKFMKYHDNKRRQAGAKGDAEEPPPAG